MSRQTILFESAQPTLMVTLFWSIMVVWVLDLTARRGQWHRRDGTLEIGSLCETVCGLVVICPCYSSPR